MAASPPRCPMRASRSEGFVSTTSSFRDTRSVDPESRNSGFDASHRPGMTRIDSFFKADLSRHCEPTGRANARPMTGSAKQSILPHKERVDCFVASLLAMTARYTSAFPQRSRARVVQNHVPRKIRGRRECRTLGASAAACAVVESTRVSHHGHAGNVRHSPRNGFNGFLRALLGDRACLPPSPVKSLSPT
jgi:hypothetical protein